MFIVIIYICLIIITIKYYPYYDYYFNYYHDTELDRQSTFLDLWRPFFELLTSRYRISMVYYISTFISISQDNILDIDILWATNGILLDYYNPEYGFL